MLSLAAPESCAGCLREYAPRRPDPGRWRFSALEAGAEIFAGAAAGAATNHVTPELQRSLPALHEDDIDDGIVLLRSPVCIAVQQAEAVMPVVGQGLA